MIVKKLKRAQTDSDNAVRYDKKTNLAFLAVGIYRAITKSSYEAIEEMYAGKGYGVFKSDIADLLVATLDQFNNVTMS